MQPVAAGIRHTRVWLLVLAERAGLDHTDDKERGRQKREEAQANVLKVMAEQARKPKDANYQFARQLIERMRAIQPLTNAATCPPRAPLPM
jgi:hypothetical protein